MTNPMIATAALMASSVQTGYAPINGLRMYYEIHGRPSPARVPLLLLHGGGSTIETSFAKLLPLVSKDRQVVAFEQQGHGHTGDADRPFSFEQSAEDAVALLRYLKIPKADLFGYSNGGHIALQVALSHPEVVHSLVLESMMYSRDGADPRFWQSFDHAKLEEMPAELKQAYLATAPHPEQLPVLFEKSVQRMRNFKGWSREQIQSVKQPVLLLLGDRDIVRVEHAAEMQKLLPDARLAVLPGTDHMGMVDRADIVAALVAQFLHRSGSP